jgi:hypothetical protein
MCGTKPLVIGVIALVVVSAAATAYFVTASHVSASVPTHCRTKDPVVHFRTDKTAFTKADVERYVKAYPAMTTSGKPAVVNEIVLVTSKDARLLMKDAYVGLPDNALVWYIQFCGPLLEDMGPLGYKPVTYPLGEEVLDAQSGRQLVWGMRNL